MLEIEAGKDLLLAAGAQLVGLGLGKMMATAVVSEIEVTRIAARTIPRPELL